MPTADRFCVRVYGPKWHGDPSKSKATAVYIVTGQDAACALVDALHKARAVVALEWGISDRPHTWRLWIRSKGILKKNPRHRPSRLAGTTKVYVPEWDAEVTMRPLGPKDVRGLLELPAGDADADPVGIKHGEDITFDFVWEHGKPKRPIGFRP